MRLFVAVFLISFAAPFAALNESPIAFEIFAKTGALGNPFIFLMAGVATDYTENGLLWSNIGRRTAPWLPAVTVPQILLLAALFNTL